MKELIDYITKDGNEINGFTKRILYDDEDSINYMAFTNPKEIKGLDDNDGDTVDLYTNNIIIHSHNNLKLIKRTIDQILKHETRHIQQILYMRENNLDVVDLLIKERTVKILEKDAIDYTNDKINDLSIVIEQLSKS